MKILLVCGDRGGFNTAIPVAELAQKLGGHEVLLHLSRDTTVKKSHADGQLPIPEWMTIVSDEQLPTIHPSAMIIGSSASKEGADGACLAINTAKADRVMMVQDYLQSGRDTIVRAKHSGLAIHRICVDSQFSRRTLIASTGYLSEFVCVTGTPQYDTMRREVMGSRWDELKDQIRAEVPKYCFLIVIAGQLNGTSELITLALHGAFAAELRDTQEFRIILRTHPRATELDSVMVTHNVTGMMSRYIYSPSKLCGVKRTEDLLPALEDRRGLVLSGYSSTNIAACICGIDAVCAGTPSFRYDFAQEKFPDTPYKEVPFPSEAENGAAWKATTFQEMSATIAAIREGETSEAYRDISQKRQKIMELNDGHSAERIFERLLEMTAS